MTQGLWSAAAVASDVMVGATSSRSQGCTDQVALDLDRTNVCMSIKCHTLTTSVGNFGGYVGVSPVLVHSMSDAVVVLRHPSDPAVLPQQSHSGTE